MRIGAKNKFISMAACLTELLSLTEEHGYVTRRIWEARIGSERQWDRLLYRIASMKVPVRRKKILTTYQRYGRDVSCLCNGIAVDYNHSDIDRLAGLTSGEILDSKEPV